MAPNPADINALMDRASSGDDDAFGELALAVQDGLFRFGLAQGLASADAAEAVQETLLRAFRGRKQWRRGGEAAAWLYGIAMNVVREGRRKRRGRAVGIDPELVAGVPNRAGAPAVEDGETFRLRRLSDAVAALPPRQREAVACRFLRRMTVRQTAAAMGCAEGTVKATVFAALKNLREKLKQE